MATSRRELLRVSYRAGFRHVNSDVHHRLASTASSTATPRASPRATARRSDNIDAAVPERFDPSAQAAPHLHDELLRDAAAPRPEEHREADGFDAREGGPRLGGGNRVRVECGEAPSSAATVV